jgi:hypothetical protein
MALKVMIGRAKSTKISVGNQKVRATESPKTITPDGMFLRIKEI